MNLAGSITLKIMLGTAILGATAGVVGTFAVLRRRALAGDMLSHAALPGICIAFLLTGSRDILALSLGALVSGLLGLLVVTLLCRWTRTKEDAAIGIVLSTFFGAGVVLLSLIQRNESGHQAGLATYLFGETAGIQLRDVQLLAGVGLASLVIVIALYKEFQLLSFDPDFAKAQGWPTFALDYGAMALLAVVTMAGLPICGVVLMAALIILPGAAARYWTNHLGTLLVLAGLFGAAAGAGGTLLASPLPKDVLGFDPLAFGAASKSVPPGPLIVLSAAAVLIVSLLLAPQRGVLARTVAELRLRLRIAREHLLRSLYELSEPNLPELPVVAQQDLVDYRSWSRRLVDWQLWRAAGEGLLRVEGDGVRLTPAGLATAAELTRTHRLWEMFLVEDANIAADHVDRDADDVEHLLPAPLLSELEHRLAAEGRLPPEAAVVPESPHELGAG